MGNVGTLLRWKTPFFRLLRILFWLNIYKPSEGHGCPKRKSYHDSSQNRRVKCIGSMPCETNKGVCAFLGRHLKRTQHEIFCILFSPPGSIIPGFSLADLLAFEKNAIWIFYLADSLLIFCFGITVADYLWLFWINIMHDPSTVLAKRAPAIVVFALSKRCYWTHPPIRLVSW